MTAHLPAPTPSQPVVTNVWRSTSGLRTALTWLLAADAVVMAMAVVAHLNRAAVITDMLAFKATFSDVQSADSFVGSVSSIYFLLFIATAVVLMVWQWRSAMNNDLLGKIRPRFSPGWSIGAWFIPFANLVIPVRIFLDLWQGSDPETTNHRDWHGLRRPGLIAWWWTCYVVGNALSFAIDDDALRDLRDSDRRVAVGCALVAAAAVLAIFVVRSITARQDAAHREPGATLPASPGWYQDPTQRFDHRYWNGLAWTDHASRSGEALVDPLV